MIPHTDGINAEHGFVSLLPTPEGKTFAVWLDGRHTKKEEINAMTLRSAEIDKDGKLSNEVELDGRVCDCCQTGATWTKKGPIVVYRDRSEDEIRDIAIRIVDQMVMEGLIPDCIDTNDNTEFDTQDIIVEQLVKALSDSPKPKRT